MNNYKDRNENCNNTNSISACGGGATVENCGNTHNHYTNKVELTINIDMRGTIRERFAERLEQVRELAGVLNFNIRRSDVEWTSNERIVCLTASSHECSETTTPTEL